MRACALGGVQDEQRTAEHENVPCLGCGCVLYTTLGVSVYTNVGAFVFLYACMCMCSRAYEELGR